MALNAIPGQPWLLTLEFRNSETGILTDPDSVQLDITMNGEVGEVPDVAGPFTYAGSSTPVATQPYRTGVGQYAYYWSVPLDTLQGAYVGNWTVEYGGSTLLGTENFYVGPGPGVSGPGAAPGDTGFWTGSISYEAIGLTIPFGSVDGNGIAWLWNKITGWDGPDVQGGGVIPKSGDHGGWASPQYYAPRQITLTVTAMAPTQALRDYARAILQQAVPVSDLAVLTYDEPIPKQALVRRSGKLTETYPDLCAVEFTIGLVAPDPRKYSTQVKTVTVNAVSSSGTGFTSPFISPFTTPPSTPGGSVAVSNDGMFETRPVITITGPVTSPALTNVTTGQTVSWTGLDVPAGQPFVVDFSLSQALLGGAYRPADPFSSWWTLPPGQSTIAIAGQLDTGAAFSPVWSDAYI